MYPAVSSRVLAFFVCREVNGVQYLKAGMREKCCAMRCAAASDLCACAVACVRAAGGAAVDFTQRCFDDKWTSYLGVAIIGIILFPVLYRTAALYARRHSTHGDTAGHGAATLIARAAT